MKKLLILSALILFSGIAFSQSLQKGNLIGIHKLTITVNTGYTVDEFMDFFTNKFIPKYEEIHPGLKIYVVKGNRGEEENKLGLLFMFNSIDARDKYWPKMGESSLLEQHNLENMTSTYEEFLKRGNWSTTFTDWIVQ